MDITKSITVSGTQDVEGYGKILVTGDLRGDGKNGTATIKLDLGDAVVSYNATTHKTIVSLSSNDPMVFIKLVPEMVKAVHEIVTHL